MSENAILNETLESYRQEGYEVQIAPQILSLPPYLVDPGDGGIDAIARKGDKFIIFQAKHHGTALEESPRTFTAEEPDVTYARSLLREAELLLSPDTSRAALLLAWAALEAVMRAFGKRQREEARFLTPRQLVGVLHRNGVISEEEYGKLQYTITARNVTAHGLQPDPISTDAILFLMDLAHRLIESQKPDQRPLNGGLITTLSGRASKQLLEAREIIEKASDVLEDVMGGASGIVSAEWETAEDALGRMVITLKLSDFSGKVVGTFDLREFQEPTHLRFRLHRLWGDLLRFRSEKKRAELMGQRREEEK